MVLYKCEELTSVLRRQFWKERPLSTPSQEIKSKYFWGICNPWGSWAGHMPRHCVRMAKISRHSLNLKGKPTTMEKENHRNGGRQGASNPVEVRLHQVDEDTTESTWQRQINFYYLGEKKKKKKESTSVHLCQWGYILGKGATTKKTLKTQEAKQYLRFMGWVLHSLLCTQHHEQDIHISQTEQRHKHRVAQALK